MSDKSMKLTRRDFNNGALLGAGAVLLTMSAPGCQDRSAAPKPPNPAPGTKAPVHEWDGYAGVGDYARSNGNTTSIREAAHLIRDGAIGDMMEEGVVETGEVYDLVIIGGGFAGLAAAHTFIKERKDGQKCLLIENHALPGGEAKRNEFVVDGYKLSAPQGSNVVVAPYVQGDWYDDLWNDIGIPRDPKFQPLSGYDGELRISKTNYMPMFGLAEQTASAGYFFDEETFGVESYWDINSIENGYANTPFTDAEKADLKRLQQGTGKNLAGDNWEQWLDGITYRSYLDDVLGIQPRVIDWLDMTLSTTGGLGSDAVSALFARKSALPGFDVGFGDASLYRMSPDDTEAKGVFSFPGGNDAVYRLLLKKVVPNSIKGGNSFEEIHDVPYRFDQFDLPDNPVRIRLNSTGVSVKHDGSPETADTVSVAYFRDGKIYRVKARGVVSACGGWVNKHVVQDLPKEFHDAFGSFVHGSNMIINVALRNWKFLADLGISACHFFGDSGLGAYCNIKQPMSFGKEPSPLDPDKPIVLTFYAGFPKRGIPAKNQAAQIRWELLSKSYADIETAVRQQLSKMFAKYGFDADTDLAGITVNRWGHSYIVGTPGFFFGKDGMPAPHDVVTKRFGRIAFGHSEHNGLQEWFGAYEHGQRAARQVLEIV